MMNIVKHLIKTRNIDINFKKNFVRKLIKYNFTKSSYNVFVILFDKSII